MSSPKSSRAGTIEVWLRQANREVTCTIVHEDERTERTAIESLSLRGAQREVTGRLVSGSSTRRLRYMPVGEWEVTYEDNGEPVESMRRFKPATDVTRV